MLLLASAWFVVINGIVDEAFGVVGLRKGLVFLIFGNITQIREMAEVRLRSILRS